MKPSNFIVPGGYCIIIKKEIQLLIIILSQLKVINSNNISHVSKYFLAGDGNIIHNTIKKKISSVGCSSFWWDRCETRNKSARYQ